MALNSVAATCSWRRRRAASTYFEKAAAQGDVDATATLGVALLLGRGVPRDEKRARRLLAVAAARGDANARRLVRCLESVDAINLDGLDSFDGRAS